MRAASRAFPHNLLQWGTMSKRRIVEAAGGILYRTRKGAPDGDIEVCVVHRPKYDD